MCETVFISYRRDDSAAEASAIAKAMRAVVGENGVFMDTSSLDYGTVFPERIKTALAGARYIVIVIGPDWLRAGSDEWGNRRIDKLTDWVRLEVESAIQADKKTVIPVLVRGGRMPPEDAIPKVLKPLCQRQAIELRRDYFDHDVELLTAQVARQATSVDDLPQASLPYPTNAMTSRVDPEPIDDAKIDLALNTILREWSKIVSPLPENEQHLRTELFREYKFRSFHEAIGFMYQLAPGCDIANHHPRWENIWTTVRVYMTTWNIGHRVSDRDVQLARYFDRAYSEYPGRG